MPDDKRNRGDQQPGGDRETDRQRNKDRKPGGGSMESPESTRTRKEDEQEAPE